MQNLTEVGCMHGAFQYFLRPPRLRIVAVLFHSMVIAIRQNLSLGKVCVNDVLLQRQG